MQLVDRVTGEYGTAKLVPVGLSAHDLSVHESTDLHYKNPVCMTLVHGKIVICGEGDQIDPWSTGGIETVDLNNPGNSKVFLSAHQLGGVPGRDIVFDPYHSSSDFLHLIVKDPEGIGPDRLIRCEAITGEIYNDSIVRSDRTGEFTSLAMGGVLNEYLVVTKYSRTSPEIIKIHISTEEIQSFPAPLPPLKVALSNIYPEDRLKLFE